MRATKLGTNLLLSAVKCAFYCRTVSTITRAIGSVQCKCLAARCSDQSFFAERLSIGAEYSSLKLAAADKTSRMFNEPDSSKSMHMANSDRTWCCQGGTCTLDVGKGFSNNSDVPERIFRVLCNDFSSQVLEQQHTFDNCMHYCHVVPFVVSPSLSAHVLVKDQAIVVILSSMITLTRSQNMLKHWLGPKTC